MAPRLSVIVPCRNGEPYLAEALDSILAQTMDGIEIVVVDDGSTDATADIARSRGPSVKLIQLPPSGVTVARQTGLAAASGRLLAFCDADDLWPTDRMPDQVAFLEGAGARACCGLSQSFLTPELRSPGQTNWTLPTEYHVSFSSLLIKQDLVRQIGPLPVDGADIHIPFFSALQDMGVAVVRFERMVSMRRVHSSNHSRQGGPQFSGYARAIKGVLERRRLQARPATGLGTTKDEQA